MRTPQIALRTRTGARAPGRFYFGWWVVAAGAGIQMLGAALLGQAYGSYVVLLRQDFGWSKTTLSGAASMRELVSGLMGPFQGGFLDRFGARAVCRVGVLVFGGGFIAFSQVQDVVTFFLAFLLMAAGLSLCGWTTITFAAVHWFERKRSTAIGLTSAGFALGGIAVPLTTLAMETFGWRETAFASGILLIVAGIPLTSLLRAGPHELGLGLDGDPTAADARRGHPAPNPGDFTLREAMRTATFWWVSLGHASALFVVSAMNVHLISFLTEVQGYSLGQASVVVTGMTAVQLIGTLTGGPIGDRFNRRSFATGCMGMHVAGLLLLSHATGVTMVAAFALLHGLVWGWRGPQMAAIRAEYFGRSAFGKILGVSNLVIILGTISGPIIAGVVYDETGSYRLGFDILAVLAGLGSIFFILAVRPKPPARVLTASLEKAA